MSPKIGIVDFSPRQDRGYPAKISGPFPIGTERECVWFGDNPDISRYRALFLSGSIHSATLYQNHMAGDGTPAHRDYPAITNLVTQLKSYRNPAFGICFGAQVLALANGGRLGRLDKIEAGILDHELTQVGRTDPVFGYLPDRFRGINLHKDYVKDLPRGPDIEATDVLATRNGYTHAYRFRKGGRWSYGIQSHPEMMTQEHSRFLFQAGRGWLETELTPQEIESASAVSPEEDFRLKNVITRFVELLGEA